MINEYAIYDMKDNEQYVYSGKMREVAKYLGLKKESLYSYISRKKRNSSLLLRRRYELVRVEEEEQ